MMMMIVASLTILSLIITITAAKTALINDINNDNGGDIGKQQRSRKLMLQRRQSRKKHQTYATSGHKRKLSSWHGPTSDNAAISSDNASSSDNNAIQHNTVMNTKSSKKGHKAKAGKHHKDDINIAKPHPPSMIPMPPKQPTHTQPPTLPPIMQITNPPISNQIASSSLVILGDDNEPESVYPLQQCQGDCDSDSDCDNNLICYQREDIEDIPGCYGKGLSGKDYCFLPPANETFIFLVIKGDENEPENAFPLGQCEGDCDEDTDCKEGLVCFQREDIELVPGCMGVGDSGSDYCYVLPTEDMIVGSTADSSAPTSASVSSSSTSSEPTNSPMGRFTVETFLPTSNPISDSISTSPPTIFTPGRIPTSDDTSDGIGSSSSSPTSSTPGRFPTVGFPPTRPDMSPPTPKPTYGFLTAPTPKPTYGFLTDGGTTARPGGTTTSLPTYSPVSAGASGSTDPVAPASPIAATSSPTGAITKQPSSMIQNDNDLFVEPDDDDMASNIGSLMSPNPLTGLKMDLFGLTSLSPTDRSIFEAETASYITSFYNDRINTGEVGASFPYGVTIVTTSLDVTNETLPAYSIASSVPSVSINCDEIDPLTLTFTIGTTFYTTNTNVSYEDVITYPFSTEEFQNMYMEHLNSKWRGFQDLVCISEVSVPVEEVNDGDDDQGVVPEYPTYSPTGMIADSNTLAIMGDGGEPKANFPLKLCQGDCDDDEDCELGLVCYQRGYNETDIPPGCIGVGEGDKDYCYVPTDPDTLVIMGDEDLGSFPLQLCQGDCDDDADCAYPLACYQRDDTEQIPGCIGDGVKESDYCYDPFVNGTVVVSELRMNSPDLYERKCDGLLPELSQEYELSFEFAVESKHDIVADFVGDLESMILDFLSLSVLRCREDDSVVRIRYPGRTTTMMNCDSTSPLAQSCVVLSTKLLVTSNDGASISEAHRDILTVLQDAFDEGTFIEFIPELITSSYLGPEPAEAFSFIESEEAVGSSSAAVIVSRVSCAFLIMFGVGVLLLVLTMITCPKLAPGKVKRFYHNVTRICNRSKHSLLTSKSPKKEEGKRNEEDVEDDSTDEDDSINLVH